MFDVKDASFATFSSNSIGTMCTCHALTMITRLLTSRCTKLRLAARDRVQGLWPVSVRRSDPACSLPLPAEHAAHAPACWSLVTDQSRTLVTSCTGCGVCTHSPNGAGSARLWTVQQHTDWPEESGRTSRPGSENQQHLPRSRKVPDRAHPCDQPTRLALTESARGSVRQV